MAKNKHHYVPKFYLRSFSSTPKRIHLYNLDQRKAIQNVGLGDQCFGNRLYGETDDTENALALLEDMIARVLHEIVRSSLLPRNNSPEKELLVLFVALQMVRTTGHAKRVNTMIDKMTKEAFRGDSRLDGVDLDQVRIGFHKAELFSLSLVPVLVNAITDLQMHLVCADTQQTFITSDNPVFKYNKYLEAVKGVGVTGGLSRGLQLFLPLSPKHLLMLYDRSVYKVDTRKAMVTRGVPDSDIATLNSLQVLSAEHNLYFNDWSKEKHVASIAEKWIKRRIVDPVRVEEFVAEADDTKSLIAEHERLPNLRLSLSFVGIQKRARQISLQDRIGTNYSLRRNPDGIVPPSPSRSPIPDGTIFVRRNRRP
jgi:Protein of unknown function (DUF4238)